MLSYNQLREPLDLAIARVTNLRIKNKKSSKARSEITRVILLKNHVNIRQFINIENRFGIDYKESGFLYFDFGNLKKKSNWRNRKRFKKLKDWLSENLFEEGVHYDIKKSKKLVK